MDDGSHRARELLERSGARYHTLLTRITLRQDVADDLLQELFLKLSRSRGFVTADNPEAYAHRVAVRVAFDWRRAQQRHGMAPLADYDPTDGRPNALVGLAAREELAQVLAAMSRLSTKAQQVLSMRFLEGHSYAEIASELGRSPHHTRAICHKAVARLRQLLADDRSPADDRKTP